MGKMAFQNALYPDFLNEMLNFDIDTVYNSTCNVVLKKNGTLITIDRGWEGIPETIIINLVMCMILIGLFMLIRWVSFSQDTNQNSWLQFIYGDRTQPTNPIENQRHMAKLRHPDNLKDDLQQLLPFHLTKCKNKSTISTITTDHNNLSSPSSSSDSTASKTVNFTEESAIQLQMPQEDAIVIQPNRGSSDNLVQRETTFPAGADFNSASIRFQFFRSDSIYRMNSWLASLFRLTEIYEKKGPDAYQYLLFQQYVIVLLSILTVVCILILLPINVQGDYEGKAYARTTLSNISPESQLYWVPAISATITVMMGVYFMHYFSKVLRTDDDLMSRTTLLIRQMPKVREDQDPRLILQEYFHQHFPHANITGIQLIFNYHRLEELEQEYVNIMNAKQFSETLNANRQVPVTLHPYAMGRCGCCCCCSSVDAVEFYTEKSTELNNKINHEIHQMAKLMPGGAFISFEREKMTTDIYNFFKEEQRKTCSCFGMSPFNASDNFDLTKSGAIVTYAPYPYDINWLNIGIDTKLVCLRKLCLSLLLFLIFFFLSTPSILLKYLEFVASKENIRAEIRISSTLTDFLSPLLLMTCAIILPSIVSFACQLIPYKTVSALNHAVMSKVFAFLLMMILILPSAGFFSINAMLDDILLPNSAQRKFRWNCLFPVDNGAFFVIYTLNAAILGNTLELMRIPELAMYVLYSMILRSPVEFEKARKMITFEFPFGVSYPRFLLIFTITITYSHACPLIAPCGLLYMLFKHFVDRYNIYHVYTPSKINGRIHSTAILYVHISLILMLFQVFTFLLTKTFYSHVTIYSLIVLLISLLVFASHCFYHWFRNMNHLTYGVTTRLNKRQKHNFCICNYTPPVFLDLFECKSTTEDSSTQPDTSHSGPT